MHGDSNIKIYKEDWFVNIVKSHESHQPNMNSTIKIAANGAQELNQMRTVIQKRIPHTKATLQVSLKKKWESKIMHGKYIKSTYRQLIVERRHIPMAVEG
jgi:hypothetical protein